MGLGLILNINQTNALLYTRYKYVNVTFFQVELCNFTLSTI